MRKILSATAMLLMCAVVAAACKFDLKRVEPTNWWIGMNNPELQLMCYGSNIGATTPEISYEGVTITRVEKSDNANYLFIYLNIAPDTKPGEFTITFRNGKKKVASHKYLLQERASGSADRGSFNSSDAIYLAMPDRFANGDPSNDNLKEYIQKVDRSDLGQRHGGDIKGVIDHIPYIVDLGCTALWITPFFENDDESYSYHHYATSDYYKVDRRLGTNEDYRHLADVCHENGLKLIIDVVPNHCGGAHWWMKDMPEKDWIHVWPSYQGSNYRMVAWTDPHASQIDRTILEKGWFSGNMPDLNLENPHLFKYLSQVYIWWIEYAGVDGIRVDTYPYNQIHVAADFMQTLLNEYKNMNIVGECWNKSPLEIAYFQSGNNNKDGFDSHLQSVMDFVLKDWLHTSFNENDGWETGMSRFYAHFAQDFAYPNPDMIMNFLDNHDIDRFSVSVDRDVRKYKMGLAMLMTTRGYPQIYSGDEIMLKGIAGNYEGHRFDFPGGWEGDDHNAFTAEGRTAEEAEVFNYTKALLNYRKQCTALQTGKMTQFIPPYNGIYVFARYDDNSRVLVVFNNSDETKDLGLGHYSEVIAGCTSGREVVTGEIFDLTKNISVPAKSALVLELK